MKQSRKRFRRFAIVVPIIIFVFGAVILAVTGWDYAQQTFMRNDSSLPTYQPTRVSVTTTKKPVTDTAHKSVSKHPSHVVLWPTLPVPGTKIGELDFPAIDLKVPVVQGTTSDVLKLGAGHYMGSPLPGQGGNVLLSGHRDTVFTKLKDLKVGDKIILTTPYGNFVYLMRSAKIVSEYNTSAVQPTNYETLTLSTCYPFYYIGSAPDRYIISTRLVSEPKLVRETTQKAP